MLVATSRYQAGDLIRASGLRPVGITRGSPRFDVPYRADLTYERRLAPERWMLEALKTEPVESRHATFESRYCDQLQHIGYRGVVAMIDACVRDGRFPGVVLLCFEDVHAGQPCHRRILADWLVVRGHDEIPELGAAVPTLAV